MMGHLGTLAVNPAIYKNLPYDPVKSFAPVSLMAIVPSVLVVNPRVPAASAAELIAYARANPGKLTYGSAGAGRTPHPPPRNFQPPPRTHRPPRPLQGGRAEATRPLPGQASEGLQR